MARNKVPSLPKTETAKELEVLAREYVAVPETCVERRRELAGVIVMRLQKLFRLYLKRATRGGRDNPGILEEDFLQDASERVLLLLSSHYRPSRGAFINLVSTAVLRLAWYQVAKMRKFRANEDVCEAGDAAEMFSSMPATMPSLEQTTALEALLGFYEEMSWSQDKGIRTVAALCLCICDEQADTMARLPAVRDLVPLLPEWLTRRKAAKILQELHEVLPDYLEVFHDSSSSGDFRE